VCVVVCGVGVCVCVMVFMCVYVSGSVCAWWECVCVW